MREQPLRALEQPPPPPPPPLRRLRLLTLTPGMMIARRKTINELSCQWI
jgi:hypothetical protein